LHLSQPGQINYTSNTLNQYTEIDRDGTVSSPSYDDDGNMTDDGTRVFTWNGENRLVSAAPKTPVDGDKKTEFVYDYMGRRVKKSVYLYDSGKSPAWQLEKYILFVYDGWNLIRETTVASGAESSRYFVWGLDLSGTLQGAGGVGGLLASVDSSGTSYSYLYDANGNVTQVLKSSDGSVAAHYEYDPYGNLSSSYGEYAAENPFRFSTKYKDDETGLYYYGYRYYDPEMGRWINRDPIQELAFVSFYIAQNPSADIYHLIDKQINPYLMVNNDTIQNTDYLGLCPRNTCNRWKIVINSAFGVGELEAGIIIGAQLEADNNCCMDNWAYGYSYTGIGFGGGVKVSGSIGSSEKWFTTPCIDWDAHNGFGRVTSAGLGIWKYTFGTLWIQTPQTYLNFTGWGTGFDASAVTSTGYWALNSNLKGK